MQVLSNIQASSVKDNGEIERESDERENMRLWKIRGNKEGSELVNLIYIQVGMRHQVNGGVWSLFGDRKESKVFKNKTIFNKLIYIYIKK